MTTLTLMYDLHQQVIKDFYTFKNQQNNYARATYSSQLSLFSIGNLSYDTGLIFKNHIRSKGRGRYVTQDYLNDFTRKFFYKLSPSYAKGIYKLRAGRLIQDNSSTFGEKNVTKEVKID